MLRVIEYIRGNSASPGRVQHKMPKADERRKWYQIKWFQPYDTPNDPRSIVKLDLLIVRYISVVSVVSSVLSLSLLTPVLVKVY